MAEVGRDLWRSSFYVLSTFSPWSWTRCVTSCQGNECRGKEAGEESRQANPSTLGEERTGLVGILYNPWIMNQVLRRFLCSYSGLKTGEHPQILVKVCLVKDFRIGQDNNNQAKIAGLSSHINLSLIASALTSMLTLILIWRIWSICILLQSHRYTFIVFIVLIYYCHLSFYLQHF